MARTSGRPETIFEQIVLRLISQLPGIATPSNVYHVIDPGSAPAPAPGDVNFAVSPLSGDADEGYFEGGGLSQLFIRGGFQVRIISPAALDAMGRSVSMLAGHSRGLWRLARRVIKALADPEWSPVDAGGNEIVRDIICPRGFDFGESGEGWVSMDLRFSLNFDWDTSAESLEAGD